jgi:hypothetical protein
MASRLRLSVRETRVVLEKVQTPAKPQRKPKAKRPEFGAGQPVLLARGEGQLELIRLPIRLANNNGGRGGSYHASATFRKKCEGHLRAWGLAAKPVRFPFPVRVRVIRVLGPHERKWDTSSILRGNYKEIEDALVAIGWFPNDSPDWIVETLPDQDDSQRGFGPAIVIDVRGA